MVESQPYQVDRLDWDQKKAFVRRIQVDHFTTAMTYSKIRIIETYCEQPRPQGGTRAHGDVHVARKTVGYKKVKLYTSENCGYGDVHLPDIELHTSSFWLTLPGPVLVAAGYRGLDVVDGFLGLGRVLRQLGALHLMCDVKDVGIALADPEDEWVAAVGPDGRLALRGTADFEAQEGKVAQLISPTLFLYDGVPGGVGFPEKLYALCDLLLEEARHCIVSCLCEAGCPSCVGPLGDVEEGARGVATDLLDWLTGRILRPRGPESFVPASELSAATEPVLSSP
jgi:DEAD/DEAH box helicase domain-containing protein